MNPSAAGAHPPTTNGSSLQSHAVDHDAILNIIRLAHAQSQKLAELWVPVTKEEAENDDAATSTKSPFAFRPEQAGLGADTSQAATSDWRGVSIGNTGGPELEKLRRQMLGRRAVPKTGMKRVESNETNDDAGMKRKVTKQSNSSDDDDDEGGRGTAFTSKRARPVTATSSALQDVAMGSTGTGSKVLRANEDSSASEDGVPPSVQAKNSSLSSKSRQTSFLDQILTERSKKKKKKRKGRQLTSP